MKIRKIKFHSWKMKIHQWKFQPRKRKILKETRDIILPSLPEEIIEEILSRLAVKSLLRFRCVSKSWRSLIDSKRFIETHYQNSTRNPNFPHQRFLFLPVDDPPSQCSLHNLLYEQRRGAIDFDLSSDDVKDINWESCETLGCYNGLVCILDHLQINLIVWNPSTRLVNKLPESSTDHCINVQYPGFGWIESTEEYKVFFAVLDRGLRRVAEVYSSKTKSWKTLKYWDLPDNCCCYDAGMCASEKLHWYSSEGKGIVWFDLKSEVIGTMELPSKMDGERLSLGVIGGCLSAVYKCNDERGNQVWVMKKYGVKESWERVASLPHILELLQRPLIPPLIIGPIGKILVLFGAGFMIYYPQHNVFSRRLIWNSYGVFSNYGLRYIESLISPQVV